MSFLKFFILGILILCVSNLTILAKDISHCLDKKYSQLKETNHSNTHKSCHSQEDEVAEICFNCECYNTQMNTLQIQEIINADISNSLFDELAFICDSLNSRLKPPPPKFFS